MDKKIGRMIHMSGAGYAGARLQEGADIDGLPGRVGDHEEMAAGFAREMQDWDKDYGKGGK